MKLDTEKTYWVYERTDDSTKVIAIISQGQVSGPKVDLVKELLTEGGWPEIDAKKVLHGSRIWATDIGPDDRVLE